MYIFSRYFLNFKILHLEVYINLTIYRANERTNELERRNFVTYNVVRKVLLVGSFISR